MSIFLLILKIIGWTIFAILAAVVLALFVKIRIVADYGETSSVKVRWLFLNLPIYPMKKKAKKKSSAATEESSEQETPVQEAPAPLPVEELPAVQPTQEEPVKQESEPAAQASSAAPSQNKPNILNIFFESNGGVDGLVLLIKEIFSYIGSFFGGMLHAFVVDELMVDMTVTKNDAAQTAIYYGQLCSTVFPMLGTFVTKYKVKKYDFNISPDFLAKKSKAEMHIAFGFRPARLIGVVLLLVGRLGFKVGFKVAFKMLRPVLDARKQAKGNTNKIIEESGASNE